MNYPLLRHTTQWLSALTLAAAAVATPAALKTQPAYADTIVISNGNIAVITSGVSISIGNPVVAYPTVIYPAGAYPVYPTHTTTTRGITTVTYPVIVNGVITSPAVVTPTGIHVTNVVRRGQQPTRTTIRPLN